jgi:ClpP class serine protease
MSSPGGGAASSERLYFETQKLREEKPVVMVMNGMVASGGYMMAMGASYTYAQSASLVGNVGVIAFSGPLIPRVLPESLVTTGPYKLSGSSRRDWIGLVEQLREGFGQMVIRERGDRLQLTETELTQGKLYAGVEAARLGLVDEVGSQSDAMEKAAELAGIANYGIVDVNAEVLRQFIQRSRRIFSSEFDAGVINMTETTDPSSPLLAPGSGIETATGEAGGDANLQELRRLLLANGLDAEQDDPLPDFPLEIGRPNLYYLYTGNGY